MTRRSSTRARESDRPPRDEKICARCGRPFGWRRKWARDWDQVRYCSDACRRGRGAEAEAGGTR